MKKVIKLLINQKFISPYIQKYTYNHLLVFKFYNLIYCYNFEMPLFNDHLIFPFKDKNWVCEKDENQFPKF